MMKFSGKNTDGDIVDKDKGKVKEKDMAVISVFRTASYSTVLLIAEC